MRIEQKDYSFFAGETNSVDHSGNVQEVKGQIKNGSLFAGDLNMAEDLIAKKKQEARAQAAKIVSDAFSKEQAIDDDIVARYRKIDESQTTKKAAVTELDNIEASKAELRELYDIAPDSQEQKDLELLEKRRDHEKSGGMEETLSEEELKRLEEIDRQGLTEYQERSLALDEQGDPYRLAIEEADNIISEESAAIRSIKLSRLKSTAILDATAQADKLLASASKDIIAMLQKEAQEITEEEKKEEEEKIEKRKEEKEEFEERLEDNSEKSEQSEQTEHMTSLSITREEIQKELEKLMQEMQLSEEELKGLEVDTIL